MHEPLLDRVLFCQTANKTISNTALQTSALGTGVGNRTIPANMLKPGNRIRIHGEGIYSSPLLLGQATVRVKLGSTIVASVATTSLGVSGLVNAASKAFTFDCLLVIREIGSSGKVVAGGTIEYTTASGSKVFDDLDNAGAEITLDTTQALMADVTVQWDSATASRAITTTIATIHLV